MFEFVKADLRRAEKGYPARPFLGNFFALYLTDRGFRAVMLYRLANWLYRTGTPWLPKLITAHAVGKTGAEIRPKATIGPGLVIKHPVGVVIGDGAKIGADCTLLQGVTIGERYSPGLEARYPTVGSRVTVCANAAILGPVSLGDDVVVGANAVVLSDVPTRALAVGVPARTIQREEFLACSQPSGSETAGCQLHPAMAGLLHQ
ncbi:MAG TPA: serine O-acetyltransferase EpsC [Tepidisphaeraceae bacterium]|jgi:serine O-acetyltransferase